MTLFDNIAEPVNPELAARDAGIAIAAESKSPILDWLRVAIRNRWRELYRAGVRDYVTADDARVLLDIAFDEGRFDRPQGKFNFMGGLFAGDDWEFTGHRIKSRTSGSHGNELKAWRYVGGNA